MPVAERRRERDEDEMADSRVMELVGQLGGRLHEMSNNIERVIEAQSKFVDDVKAVHLDLISAIDKSRHALRDEISAHLVRHDASLARLGQRVESLEHDRRWLIWVFATLAAMFGGVLQWSGVLARVFEFIAGTK